MPVFLPFQVAKAVQPVQLRSEFTLYEWDITLIEGGVSEEEAGEAFVGAVVASPKQH